MNKTFCLITLLLFVSTAFISCRSSSADALKYNESIVEQQKKVYEKETALVEAISKNLTDSLDMLYENLKTQIDKSSEIIRKMEAFDDKTIMKDEALNLFKIYKNVLENDYKEIIILAKTPDSLYTQDTDDSVIELSKNIDNKLNTAIDEFVAVQNEFSKKYKFEITAY